MRIVISSKHYTPMLGGSIRYAEMLAEEFHRKGCEVVVMTRTSSSRPDTSPWKVVRNPGFSAQCQLAKWAEVLIQVDASWRDVIPFLLYRVPWFPTVHNGKLRGNLGLRARIGRMAQAVAFHVGHTIPVSEDVRREWNISGSPIPNPYDDGIFGLPAREAVRDIDLIFVGRVVASKGVFVWLEALERIRDGFSNPVRCAVIGEGEDLVEMKHRVVALGPEFLFTFLGKLDAPEVAQWMRRSRILVFPTTPEWVEASPLTVLEAQACGCRIIAADNGGTRENLGPEAKLVISGDMPELATALQNALATGDSTRSGELVHLLKSRSLTAVGDRYLERFRSIPVR